MDQITEKQHFVPRFYLKNFADTQGFLRVLDVKNKRIIPKKPYGAVGYASFFYATRTGQADEMSQHIESWLGEIENYVAGKLPRIIEKILDNEHINDDDRYTIAVLLSMQWLRTPAMRGQLNRMEEQFTKRVMSMNTEAMVDKYITDTGKVMSSEQRAQLIETFKDGRYDMKFSNVQHVRFMVNALGFGEKGFANMFYGKKWKIYIARGNERFITSDNPVVEWFRPPAGFYGRSFLDRNHYLALTPEILLELTYPRGSTKVKRHTIFPDQDNLVKMLNIVVAAHSLEHVYATNEKSLADIVRGFSYPGEAERMYYQQFEQPWEEYNKKRNTSTRTVSAVPPKAG